MTRQNHNYILKNRVLKKADARNNVPEPHIQAAVGSSPQIPDFPPSLLPISTSTSNITQDFRGREHFRSIVRKVCAQSSLSEVFEDKANLSNIRTYSFLNDDQADLMVRKSMVYTGLDEILTQLRNHVPNLLGSFCIVSLQLPGYPVQVASKDLFLRDDLAEGQAYFIPDKVMEQPWVIRQEFLNDGLIDQLTIQGDIFERNLGSKASHRFVGQLDLTALVRDLTGGSSPLLATHDEGPWLSITHEEMDNSRARRSHQAEVHFPHSAVVDAIRLLHACYFIVKRSDNGYDITHLAPDLIQSIGPDYEDLPTTAFLDLESLRERFERGEKFCTKVLWEASKVHEWLYCIPHFCPDLESWLCFIVDGNHESFWAWNS